MSIIEAIIRIINFVLGKKEKTEKQIEKDEKRQEDVDRLKEDIELKDAIQNGDWETVERIRKKKKEYKNL